MTSLNTNDALALSGLANAVDLGSYVIQEILGNELSTTVGEENLTTDVVRNMVATNIASELTK